MSFKLQANEQLDRGIRRAVRSQINRAVKEIDQLACEGTVHQMRKRFKRVRALARLVRDQISTRDYKQIEKPVQQAGKQVSLLRDAEVLLATLETLRGARSEVHLDESTFNKIHAELVARRNLALSQVLANHEALNQVASDLKEARRRADEWKLDAEGIVAIAGGLTDIYEKATGALATALVDPAIDKLHAWRKKSKYLWNQLQFLCELAPRFIEPLARQLHELGDLLGDDHDLGVLAQTIIDNSDDWKIAECVRPLEVAAHKRRTRLQDRAFSAGRRLFEKTPQEFAEQLCQPCASQ